MRLRLPRFDRTTTLVTIGVVVFALLYVGVAAYIGTYYEQSASESSIFSRAPEGLSVWYGYLTRLKLDAKALTQFDTLPAGSTIIVAAPLSASPTPREATRLADWVKGGGRLVLVSTEMPALLADIGTLPEPAVASIAASLPPALPGTLSSGVTLIAPGPGRLTHAAPEWVTDYGDESGAVVLTRVLGRGEIVWLADSTAVSNAGIGNADDAALAVALADAPGRPIYFDEFHHGYADSATAWDRLAAGGRASVVLALIAVGVLLLALGRRTGPPIAEVAKTPARGSAYIAQLAALYRKAGARAEALETLEDGLGRALTRRYGTRAIGVARLASAREALESSAALRSKGEIRTDEFLVAARRLRQARHEVEGN